MALCFSRSPVKGAIVGGMADRTYRLIVEGELSDELGLAFHGMTLTRTAGNTALTGNVRDQSELNGLLQRVSDFGLTLLEVRTIDDGREQRLGPSSAATNRFTAGPGGRN